MSKTPNGFYVYAYLRETASTHGDAGTPYYIGKGIGRRAWHKGHRVKMPKNPERIVILVKGLTENEAFSEELRLIGLHGRINNGSGCLHNLTDGGSGLLDPESTKKLREQRAAEQRRKKISKDAIVLLQCGLRSWRSSLSQDELDCRKEIARQAGLNRRHTEESKKKMRGKRNPLGPRSEETKKKISDTKQRVSEIKNQQAVDNFLESFYLRIRQKQNI